MSVQCRTHPESAPVSRDVSPPVGGVDYVRGRTIFRHLKRLVSGYLALSVATLAAITVLRNDRSAVNSAVWNRATIVALSALLTFTFTRRAALGSARAFLRLRIVSAVMLVAIAVIVAVPGTFPMWMKLEQAACGLILVSVVALVNDRRVRGSFHAGPKGSTVVSRELMIPAADTRLYAVDVPGATPALLFLGGGFGTVKNWSHVIRRLDGKYRTVRFDARARGRSGRSADYSVRAAVEDIERVIDATGLERPILVGWSQGATIAVRYAAQHPTQVGGLVLIDGAYPIGMFDAPGKRKVRTQFRRLGWIMRILAALGRSAQMSPAESADVVIEMDAVNGELGPDFAALECPTVFVVGTGAHAGATEDEMRTVRAAVADAEQRNERVSVFATTAHNHTQILNKDPDTVVAAIENVITRLPEERSTDRRR